MASISQIIDPDEQEAFEISDSPNRTSGKSLSEKELEQLYDSSQFRILQERNDFLLPQILEFVQRKNWINLRPEYQRRLRWDNRKKSLLIESLLMNIPIPPVFLYEHDLSRYEVMDGQQRLNAIMEFYNNDLKLTGLPFWSSLNGRTYSTCPPRIKRGLDRRRISAVVLLAESSLDVSDTTQDIRTYVFERLNTGGQKLNPQELRNCLYSGLFNDMIVELAGLRLFNEIWEIPPYEDNIRADYFVSDALAKNSLYKTMGDCQIVLRFFAFRKQKHVKGSVRKILDKCMERNRFKLSEEIEKHRNRFITRLEIAHEIFGPEVFRLPEDKGRRRLSRPLYDAIMIGIDQLWSDRDALVTCAPRIRKNLREVLREDSRFYDIVVGRPNTTTAISERIRLLKNLMEQSLR